MRLSVDTLHQLAGGDLDLDASLYEDFIASMTFSEVRYGAFYDAETDRVRLQPLTTKENPMSKTTTNGKNESKTEVKNEVEPKSGKKLESVLDLINANLQLVRQGILAVKHWMRFSGRGK